MARSQTKTLLLASLLAALLNACNAAEPGQEIAPGVRLFAYIRDPRIKESSGVVASRRHSVYWTHNDGGGPRNKSFTRSTARATRARPSPLSA